MNPLKNLKAHERIIIADMVGDIARRGFLAMLDIVLDEGIKAQEKAKGNKPQ